MCNFAVNGNSTALTDWAEVTTDPLAADIRNRDTTCLPAAFGNFARGCQASQEGQDQK